MMVFKSDAQRKGFFARVSGQITKLKKASEKRQLAKIDIETKKLQALRKTQSKSLDARRKEQQAEMAVLKQKQELDNIIREEKQIKKELFDASRVGRTLALAKKDVTTVGRGIKKVATSKQTKSFFKTIGKGIKRL